LAEAKGKVKEIKKAQADKMSEGVLSGGDRPCSECGGTGMVYEEPKAIPDHVKSKVEKYNKQAKAFHAASKRLDKNHNGIPDDEEMEEGFGDSESKEMKVGDTKKTRTGELTKTSKGVIHKNTSYHDDGEAEEKSGKGIKSHAKAQSAAEKKDRAPAQKQSPKSAKTWGMKDGSKFDNRDKQIDEEPNEGNEFSGELAKARASHSKEFKVDGKTFPVKEAAKPSAGLSKEKKSAVVKKAKSGGDIGKPGKSFDKVAKAAGGGKKGEKIAAAAMWKNIKETTAYIEEKRAAVKDLPGNQEKIDVAEPKGKIDSKDMAALRAKKKTVSESVDVARIKALTKRLVG
jgi:hypothetical protein